MGVLQFQIYNYVHKPYHAFCIFNNNMFMCMIVHGLNEGYKSSTWNMYNCIDIEYDN
jgi:hypothetical protein